MILVIGNGRWSQNIQRTLNQLGATPYKVATYDWYKHIASATKVIIAAPAKEHFHIATRAIALGKPCFIEKPMCLDSKDASVLKRFSLEQGVPIMVGHIWLHNENFVDMMQKTKNNHPKHITVVDGNNGPFRDDVDALWDYGPHAVSALFMLARSRKLTITKAFGSPNSYVFEGTVGSAKFEWRGGREFPVKDRFITLNTGLTFEGLDECHVPPLLSELDCFTSGWFDNEVLFGAEVVNALESFHAALTRRETWPTPSP